MLAQILGSGLSFKQTSLAILMSFAVAAVILGGFSPITLFIWYNAPPLSSEERGAGAQRHATDSRLCHCLCRNHRESPATRFAAKNERPRSTARAVLFSWLAGNLFLGAQLAWNLRPFIGIASSRCSISP